MSLILDALRKADAERERGSVPSLHSHPVAPTSAEALPASRARPTWPWIAIGVAVGVAAAAAWVMATQDRSPAAVASPAPSLSPPAASAALPAPPVAPPPQPASAGAAGAASANPGVAAPAPWPQPEERKARPDAKEGPQVTYLGNVPPADAGVVSREQLPPEIRGALPPITIGGSIYSPNPGGRSLIVNGQLFRERDRLTQDLSLEEIKLKAAVFSFRGYRFEVLF